MDWVQFYAVRDSWRDAGSTSLGPILAKWREHGLTKETYDGSKINIETYGPVRGTVKIAGYIPRDETVVPPRLADANCHLRTD